MSAEHSVGPQNAEPERLLRMTDCTCAKRCVPQMFLLKTTLLTLSNTICEKETPNCYILTKGPDTQKQQNKRAAMKADCYIVSCCLCLRERAATH